MICLESQRKRTHGCPDPNIEADSDLLARRIRAARHQPRFRGIRARSSTQRRRARLTVLQAHKPSTDGQWQFTSRLSSDSPKEELAQLVSCALDYWSARDAGKHKGRDPRKGKGGSPRQEASPSASNFPGPKKHAILLIPKRLHIAVSE
jgi:hypothetical protein